MINQLRIIGFVEGISYLVLLFVAMPLKYGAGWPDAVRVVGMSHGILFVMFVVWVLIVGRTYRWRFSRYVYAAIASVVPFGTFVFDRTLRHQQPRNEEKTFAFESSR